MKETELRWRLMSRFVIRFHMLLILAGTAVGGVLCNALLLRLGVTSMEVRFGLATLGAYAIFFLMIRLWLSFVTTFGASVFQREKSKPAKEVSSPSYDAAEAGVDGADVVLTLVEEVDAPDEGGLMEGAVAALDESAVLVLLGAVFLSVLSAGAYFVWQAPMILSEAAFQFALSIGLIRPLRRLDDPDWAAGVLRTTWIPLVVILLVAVVAGFLLQAGETAQGI
jgi:hypothetical protein